MDIQRSPSEYLILFNVWALLCSPLFVYIYQMYFFAFFLIQRFCSPETVEMNESSDFSSCRSDESFKFPNRRLISSNDSDYEMYELLLKLESKSIEEKRQAALDIRLLSKDSNDNRMKIIRCGAIQPLISLICSSDRQLQEYGVTAILNLCLCDDSKRLIVSSGAIMPLVNAIRIGTTTAKENASCALLRLSQIEENKVEIGRSGAVPLLVKLLELGDIRGKKDASTALYSLCSIQENKLRAVDADIVKTLIELMADSGSTMVDKATYLLNQIISIPEAVLAAVENNAIPVLVEMIEIGTDRQKEIATAVLLKICEENSSESFRCMAVREGAIPPLVELSQCGTDHGRRKAWTLLQILRRLRSGPSGNILPEISDVSF